MCFSAGASLGAAAALLPVGAYCLEAAWRKDRRYLPLAATPVLFGVQQLCEAVVWAGFEGGHPEMVRVGSLAFLFFALAFWPAWVPLAAAALEGRGWRRRAFVALAGAGVLFGAVHYGPVAAGGGHDTSPAVVGHSVRYDFPTGSWVWPALYMTTVAGPLVASRNRRLRPLGAAVVLSAVAAYVLFEEAFASVWCFLAAALSLYLAHALHRVPGPGVAQPPSGTEPPRPGQA